MSENRQERREWEQSKGTQPNGQAILHGKRSRMHTTKTNNRKTDSWHSFTLRSFFPFTVHPISCEPRQNELSFLTLHFALRPLLHTFLVFLFFFRLSPFLFVAFPFPSCSFFTFPSLPNLHFTLPSHLSSLSFCIHPFLLFTSTCIQTHLILSLSPSFNDFNRVSADEVRRLVAGDGSGRVQR